MLYLQVGPQFSFAYVYVTVLFLGTLNVLILTHHKISRKQFLQKLGLFVLNGFNDELVVAGEVEERSAGPRV